MAATVESAFVLIDRASGPIRRIRRELRELEVDARRTGRTLDDMSGPRAARQMDQLARETRTFGDDTRYAGREVDQSERKMRRLEQRTDSLTRKTRKSRLEFGALGKVLSVLKWPAMIAGIGGATQALGGLTAGAVALLPKILDLGGAGAAFGTTMVGVGAAMGVVKLATSDLTKAYTGNKNALKSLTPEGRAFLQMLRGMHPEIQRLRQTAQRGLFPGLGDLLGSARSQMPQIRGIVGQTSRDLGGLARFLGKQISGGNFMGDLATLSDQGARALGAAARSGFYFGQAIEHVLIAAGPFTDWLGTAVERLAKMTDRQALAARESGRLGTFFDRTRKSVTRLADIGKHTFEGLRGLMRAARGEGDSLWKSIDDGVARWDKWANSVSGQTSMRRWFDDMRPVLGATVGLVGDLGKAIASLTQGPEGAQMMNALRDALPSVVGGVRSLTTSLGPAVIDAFGSFVHLLGDAAGNAGPLTLLARSVGLVATAADSLLHVLGPLGPGLATAIGTFALLRKMNVFGALDTLRAKWALVGTAAGEAAVAERNAILGGAGGGGGMPVVVPGAGGGGAGAALTEAEMLAGGVAGGMAARGLSGPAGAVGGVSKGGVILPSGVRSLETASAASGGAGFLARARMGLGALRGGGAAGLVSKGLGVAGKFAWPLMVAQGLFGALGTQGGIGAKAQGGASALTFGIIPRPISDDEKKTKGGEYAANVIGGLNNSTSIGAQRQTVRNLRQRIGTLGGDDGFDQNANDFKTANDLLQAELKRRQQILTESLRAQRESVKEASIQHGQSLSEDFAKAFEIRAKANGPVSAMETTVEGVLHKMRGMHGAGAKVLDENMLAWARQQAKNNPLLLAQVQKLEDGIKRSFSRTGRHVQIVNGQILTGSTTEWKNIKLALTTQTEKAREDVSADFTAIQQQAVGSLTAMGFSASDARKMVQSMETGGKAGAAAARDAKSGPTGAGMRPSVNDANLAAAHGFGKKRARGGRLPGRGTQDNVPMVDGGWGAPGELVINRHTERDADSILSLFGTKLDRLVANETRPHSAAPKRARGGRLGAVGGGLHPGIAAAVSKVLGQFPGLSITSTTGGGHAAGSYHYKGEAADIAGSTALMDRAAAWIGRTMGGNLTEGIHNPNLSIKGGHRVSPSFWGSQVWGEHANHIHLAIAGALGGLSGLAGGLAGGGGGAPLHMKALRSPLSRVGGLPGMAANAAGSMYATGLTKKINAHLGGMGGGAGGGGGLGGGTSGANQKLGRAMMLAMGWGADQWPALKALWTRESGWNQNARNPSSGAYGIPQALGHGNVFGSNPRDQIAWGLRYIKGRYGSPSGAWAHETSAGWYAHGGRLGPMANSTPVGWGGWNAKGGDYMVNRPTVFGAGERGPERVTITPKGQSSRVIVRPVIERGAIHIDAGGNPHEVERAVERALRRFVDGFAEGVDGGAEEDEGALIS